MIVTLNLHMDISFMVPKVCDDWLKDNRQFIQWSKNAGYMSGDVLRRKDTNIGFNPDNCYYSKPGKSAFKITYSGSTEFLS